MKFKIITAADAHPRIQYDGSHSEYLITLELQDKPKIIDAKTGDFVIEKEAVETSRINTQEYIDSFAGDVGIENILQKFALTGDPTLFEQRKRPSVPIEEDGKEQVQDYSNIPTNFEEANAIAANAAQAYQNLPGDLVNNRSFMEFAESCTDAELTAYIQRYVEARNKTKEEVK